MADPPDEAAGVTRAAVLGSPISHSLSPALHRAAYAALGLDWTYDAIDVDADELAGFLEGLDGRWAGLSLTMPLKQVVIPLLTDVDAMARSVGSVNTLLPSAGGWRGTNTDIVGIAEALTRAGLARDAGTATLLGAGATARSAVAALAGLGVAQVTVCARRPEPAEDVAEFASRQGMSATTSDLEPDRGLVRADVVVSTLPGDAGAPWAAMVERATGVLLDASYHPWPSPLAAAWVQGSVASGRDMLLWQAVEQVRLMTGLTPPVDRMLAALPD